jgi:hypothetical protein
MGLGVDELAAIDALLAAESVSPPGAGEVALADFRRRFPRLSVTRCDSSDVDSETPFRALPGMSLFLVDASDHCWRITSDPASATGIVLARDRIRPQEGP